MKRAARSRGLSRQQEGFPKPHRPARPQESTEQHPQATEVELDSVAAAAWCESIFTVFEALARGETPDRVAIDAARLVGRLRRLHVYELVEAAGRLAGIAASAEASSRCREALVARFVGVLTCASCEWPALLARDFNALARARAFLKVCMRAAERHRSSVSKIEKRLDAARRAGRAPATLDAILRRSWPRCGLSTRLSCQCLNGSTSVEEAWPSAAPAAAALPRVPTAVLAPALRLDRRHRHHRVSRRRLRR
mmetsp:Transcript_25216/g.79632  ORF Transcript_25216/g.79632 Transcript_25216/m.79632 type:complete len:252 (+) Transcript_25216:358-1113(+)